MPVQRIPRYKLLLQGIVDNTPDELEEGRDALLALYNEVEGHCDYLNKSTAIDKASAQVAEVHNRFRPQDIHEESARNNNNRPREAIDGVPTQPRSGLVAPNRYVVAEVEAVEAMGSDSGCSELRLFIFNDMLLKAALVTVASSSWFKGKGKTIPQHLRFVGKFDFDAQPLSIEADDATSTVARVGGVANYQHGQEAEQWALAFATPVARDAFITELQGAVNATY